MHIRNGRLRTFAVLTTLATLVLGTVQIGRAGQTSGTENSLVGITLRTSTFRDVMRKFGQPDEVQGGGGPFLPTPPKGTATTGGGMAGGGGMSGAPGSGGGRGMAAAGPGSGGGMSGGGMSGGGNSGGKRYPSKSGFPGKNDGAPAGGGSGGPGSGGGLPGMIGPGSGGGPRSGGGMPGMAGPGSGGGMPGMAGPGSGGYPGAVGGGKGLPGFPGAVGGGGPETGGGPGGGMPGAVGAGGGGEGSEQAEAVPSGETTWWYHNPRKGYHVSFLFDKEGRVIQIQEYGYSSLHNGHTRQGIMLGSNMTQVLARYGWSNDGAHDGENVIMRYGGHDKVAFQMVKNRVLGITVAVGH